MAKLPKLEKLSIEQLSQFPEAERLERLIPSINNLVDGVGLINKSLTFGDNFYGFVKDVNIEMPPTDWVEIQTLSNGWGLYGGGPYPKVRKSIDGTVMLRSMLAGGTVADNTTGIMYTLPEAYRIESEGAGYFPASCSGGFGKVAVNSNGTVGAASGDNTWFSAAATFVAADRTPVVPACFPTYFRWDGKVPPKLVWTAGVRDRGDSTRAIGLVANTDWEFVTKDGVGQVKIRNVIGLQYGRKYALTVVALAG